MQTLRQLRRTRDLTFVDLALLTGIPARVIAEAEYGMRRLSRGEAEAIALVLGLSPAALLPPPPRPSPQANVLPLALTAGLAATLAVAPLATDVAPTFQRQLQAALLNQAYAQLIAAIPTAALPAAVPAQLAVSPARSVALATPTPDALAPLIAPAPPLVPSPTAVPQFYLDETGPHGCPVQPSSGQVVITQGYGVGTHTPAHIWGAIDLAVDGDGDGLAEPGPSWYAPVVATHDGVVKVTMNSYPAGNHVSVITLDGVWRTGYSHLAIVTVIDGQQVRAGEVIGLMGSTGFASGPHLDYQVWRGDVNIDPTALVGCGVR